MNKITTRTVEAFIDETGILRIKIFDGVIIDLADAVNNFLAFKQLSAGQRRLKLIEGRSYWRSTKEARNYSLKDDIPEKTIAKAVLVRGIIGLLIYSLLMKRSNPNIPVKIFLSENKALKWLNSFKDRKMS
ncbi:MAG: hypothetical protein Q8L90_12585 [Bacteroidota bacterium]|nr:hypothetical protein [Bacteroidota bacterium]